MKLKRFKHEICFLDSKARIRGRFFYSPIFYVVTTVFLVLYSFLFFAVFSDFSQASMAAAAQMEAVKKAGYSINANEMLIAPSLANMSIILLFIIPLITMRSFAEEKKNKTFSLLLSSPVNLSEIVVGKFLACLGVITFMILLSSYSIVFVGVIGQPELGADILRVSGHDPHDGVLYLSGSICLFIDRQPDRRGCHRFRTGLVHVDA